MKWYSDLIHTPQALLLYLKRKPSVEPTFALIKELFDLEGEKRHIGVKNMWSHFY